MAEDRPASSTSRSILESAKIGFYQSTVDGWLIDANNALVEMLGFPDLKHLKSVNLKDLYANPENYVNLSSLLENKGTLKSYEVQLKTYNGEIIWVRDTPKPIWRGGKVISFEGTLEDITERVKMENSLRESEAKLKETNKQLSKKIFLLESINEISRDIVLRKDVDGIYRYVLEKSAIIVNSGKGVILEKDSSGDLSVLYVLNEKQRSWYERRKDVIAAILLKYSKSSFANRGEAIYSEINGLKTKIPNGFILCRVYSGENKEIFFLGLNKKDGSFDADDLDTLMAISRYAAITIKNVLLYEKLNSYAAELEKKYKQRTIELEKLYHQQEELTAKEKKQRLLAEQLQTLTQAINSSLELNKVLDLVLINLKRVVDYDYAVILAKSVGGLTSIAAKGFAADDEMLGKRIDYAKNSLCTNVCKTKKPYIQELFVEKSPVFLENVDYQVECGLGVPLVYRDELVGILSLYSKEKNAYGQKEAEIAFTFANHAVTAIENARLYNNKLERINQLDALRATSTEISAVMDLTDLLQSILKRAIDLVHASGGELALCSSDDDDYEIVANIHAQEEPEDQQSAIGDTILRKVIELKEPLLRDKNGQLDGSGDDKIPALNIPGPWVGIIAVPLLLRKKILGGIVLIDNSGENQFSVSDMNLLTLFAQQAAIAIDNARLFEQVQQLATIDELTGIYNRRKLFELGRAEFNRSKRYNIPFSVLLIDIDNFKHVNDQYGHATGDIVLKKVTEVCGHSIRDVDILGRYGGEEFVVLLPYTTLDQACIIAKRLRKMIEETEIEVQGNLIRVTVSIGVVQKGAKTQNIESLLDRADTAMYKAKDSGRNNYYFEIME